MPRSCDGWSRSSRAGEAGSISWNCHIPATLGQSNYAVTSRSLAQKAFPDGSQWPVIDYHVSELRWVDAAHMDERSAIIVAREIDGFLRRLTAPKLPSQACVRHAPRANCRISNPGET